MSNIHKKARRSSKQRQESLMAHVYLYVLLICPALLVAAYFLVLDGRPPAAPEVTTAESSSFAAAPSLRGASSSAASAAAAAAAAAAAVASSSSPLSYPSSAAPRPPAAEAPASIAAATAATTATTAAAPVATSQQPPGGRTSSCATPCKTLSNGVEMPLLLYGTAWKEGRTEALVAQALRLGFRGVDTANQKRHYNEEGVGRALAKAVAAGDVRRSELFLQSKFTFPRGHSPGQEPYSLESSSSSSSASSSSSSSSSSPLSSSGSASASSGSAETTTGRQVRESFASSLKHLGTTYLDSYIIHGPLRHGTTLSGADLDAWRALEALYATGKVRAIGVSNFGQEQLRALAARAAVKPHVAQIRTFAARGWDDRTGGVRAACEELGVVFQAYSLLTANRQALRDMTVKSLAEAHHDTAAQLAFRFALGEGLVALTGTTSEEHMRQDLDVVATLNDPQRGLPADERAAVAALGKRLLDQSTHRQKRPAHRHRGPHMARVQ